MQDLIHSMAREQPFELGNYELGDRARGVCSRDSIDSIEEWASVIGNGTSVCLSNKDTEITLTDRPIAVHLFL